MLNSKDLQNLISIIKTLSKNKSEILVVGDVMLDQYWYGLATRISPEAPVPVIHVKDTENRIGGAANVAANIAALNANATLLGIVGEDTQADILTNLLNEKNINTKLLRVKDNPTILKLRILSSNQQLLRLDKEEKFINVSRTEIISKFKSLIASKENNTTNDIKVVVFSDYAKGTLTHVKELIALSKENQKTVIVDPKLKDFSNYVGADVITPNLKEFEEIVGPCNGNQEIVEKAINLIKKYNFGAIIVTKGGDGITVVKKTGESYHVDALGSEVFDVTGAGDTVISMLALAISKQIALEDAAMLASFAAGIVVGKVGTSVATIDEIETKILDLYNHSNNIVDNNSKFQAKSSTKKTSALTKGMYLESSKLRESIKIHQQNGEKVVFVNGCFDVVHSGHMRLLERAKSLGDRLVVGVNSDESIKRLKGPNRPIHNIVERMEVLSSIKSVDWVIPFYEDTPGALVEALSPDILAKNGKSFASVQDIPENEGAKFVLANGGKVVLFDETQGCSSSEIINKIKAKEKETEVV